MTRIIPAQVSDLPVIAKLENQLFPQPWSQKSFEEILAQEAFWFWVVKKGKEVVGYLVCQVVEKEAELHNIAVAKPYQRQGIAKLLLSELKKQLISKGVTELFLMVRASNIAAQRLYEHVGFKKTSVRRNYYQPQKEDAWVYQLGLG